MSGLVTQFEIHFVAVAQQYIGEERLKEQSPIIGAVTPGGWNMVTGQLQHSLTVVCPACGFIYFFANDVLWHTYIYIYVFIDCIT